MIEGSGHTSFLQIFLQMLLCSLLIGVPIGCGGGSPGGGGSSGNQATGNSVVFKFDSAPRVAAIGIGGGNFELTSVDGNSVSVGVPSGTSNYSFAYVCPPILQGRVTFNLEFVIQASIQDGTTFSVTCSQGPPPPTLAPLTGSVNGTGVPGAASLGIASQGFQSAVTNSTGTPIVNGPFSVKLPTGPSDVGVFVFDNTKPIANFLATKIVRNQAVPGVLNGGNTVIFQPSDAMTNQPLTISNFPAGFSSPPQIIVTFLTANGLSFSVDTDILNPQFATEYLAVPSAAMQSGDFYNFQVTAQAPSQFVRTSQNMTGGGPVTISLPAPFSYMGPTPATLPTFSFNYSGFPTLLGQQATISWSPNQGTGNSLIVTATANFQNGATTIAVPNLSSLSGFLPPVSSGTVVDWVADIYGGTAQPFTNFIQQTSLFQLIPSNSGNVLSDVESFGQYTAP